MNRLLLVGCDDAGRGAAEISRSGAQNGRGKLADQALSPHLARQKDETLGIIRDRGLGKPTLLAWSYQDPTASIDQGYALFDLITRSALHLQSVRSLLLSRTSGGVQ